MLVLLWMNFLLTFSHCVFTHIFWINQNGNVTLQIRFCEKVTQIRFFFREYTKCKRSLNSLCVSSASPLRYVPAWLFYASDWLLTRSLRIVPHSFAVVHAENFHRRVSFSIWWSFVLGVRYLWRHSLTSYFQTNVLAKFFDIICVFFYTCSPYFMCHYTEYKLSALQGGYRRKINSTLRHSSFISAKISGCVLKQGSKTNSSLRQRNLQLQNEAALASCRMRAVQHRKSAVGLAGAHPELPDWLFLEAIGVKNLFGFFFLILHFIPRAKDLLTIMYCSLYKISSFALGRFAA